MSAPLFDFSNNPEAEAKFRDDPFGLLSMLRENQPVLSLPDRTFAVSRYADLERLIKRTRGGFRDSAGKPVLLPESDPDAPIDGNDFMLLRDGEPHARLRKLVSKAFTPRMVEGLRPAMEQVANESIDRALERGDLDVARDLARVVPSTIICMMLGIPLADRESFTDWTAHLTHALTASQMGEVPERVAHAFESLLAYTQDLIAERRKAPRDDLVSEMIAAEESGDRLTESELVIQTIGLLVAGFETTIGLIGLGARQILRHPDELARLKAEPDLIESAIEECLRIDPPIIATLRVVHEDVEFHGVEIPRDSRVVALIGAANRDPRAFDDPDRFDVGRKGQPHWSFGGSEHFCLGANLARLEAQVALGTLVRRVEGLSLKEDGLEWSESLFRVPSAVPVDFEGPA